MKLCGVEPAGQAGYGIELSKQPANQLVCIVLGAELIELTEHVGECLVRRGDKVETALIKQRLDLAQARAEIPIKASCFCRRMDAKAA